MKQTITELRLEAMQEITDVVSKYAEKAHPKSTAKQIKFAHQAYFSLYHGMNNLLYAMDISFGPRYCDILPEYQVRPEALNTLKNEAKDEGYETAD